jgi:transposase-like protein
MKYKNHFRIRPMTCSELSHLYGVHRHTFRRWMKPLMKRLGKRTGNFFNVNQVKLILKILGVPVIVPLDDTFLND